MFRIILLVISFLISIDSCGTEIYLLDMFSFDAGMCRVPQGKTLWQRNCLVLAIDNRNSPSPFIFDVEKISARVGDQIFKCQSAEFLDSTLTGSIQGFSARKQINVNSFKLGVVWYDTKTVEVKNPPAVYYNGRKVNDKYQIMTHLPPYLYGLPQSIYDSYYPVQTTISLPPKDDRTLNKMLDSAHVASINANDWTVFPYFASVINKNELAVVIRLVFNQAKHKQLITPKILFLKSQFDSIKIKTDTKQFPAICENSFNYKSNVLRGMSNAFVVSSDVARMGDWRVLRFKIPDKEGYKKLSLCIEGENKIEISRIIPAELFIELLPQGCFLENSKCGVSASK